MKRLLRDRRGMTLTEILVAITILMIVIVGVTPIMLSSYDSLYTAGEYTKDTYEAKSEIEDTLATRNSLNIYEAFKVNFEGLGEVASINGKRAVSSLYGSLETIFTGGRAHITIVSSKVINDDKHSHDVILQTTNITFKSAEDISCNTPSYVTNEVRSVDVSVYIPDKTRTNLASIYASKTAGVTITKATPATGRIYVKIQDLDFTNSPAKIEVTYRDENNKVRKASCYLTIKTPTIMMVGSTNYGDYYTSAGVETFSNSDGSKTSKLIVAARQMDISGSSQTKDIPAGTVFKSVNWITEQTATTGEFVESPYEPSYYVLTGTNGAIYRTYTFEGYNTGENAVLGKVNLSISGGDQASFQSKFHNVISQQGQDVLGIQDQVYILDDAKATTVYPAIWGADFSHIFAYSTYNESMGYYNQGTWYTQDGSTSGKGQPGYYSNFANFGYYYNGYGMKFSFYTQNSKKISYILTELDYPIRVAGYMDDPGDFDQSFNRMWERPIFWDSPTVWRSQDETYFHKAGFLGIGTVSEGWYYYKKGENFPRAVAVQANEDDEYFQNNQITSLPVYFASNTSSASNTRWKDEHFAQLRLKCLTTLSPNFLYDRWQSAGGDGFDGQQSDVKFAYNTNLNDSKIAVTDAVYIPATSTTSGGVFYVGTVAAYGYLQQADNVATYENYGKTVRNNGKNNFGGITSYYFMGNPEGTTTTVYKYSTPGEGTNGTANRSVFSNKTYSSILSGEGVKVNSPEGHQFFVIRHYDGTTSQLFNDVLFTMGFASNREMVYSKIVYGADASGAIKEAYKFCEPLYYLSHYDDLTEAHVPNLYMNPSVDKSQVTAPYLNSTENDYYNAWFPGEMYNLTKIATKDGVTVSVGYAVAGSTYTWINPVDSAKATNNSTGLGGVYNDGVLAAMVLGKDKSFSNLLYFKDNASMDTTSLSDNSVPFFSGADSYKSLVGVDYGTHTRDSVQFTAVDISIEYVLSGNSEVATYYAYYADNKGRLYKSKVATKSTDINAASGSTPQMVSYISDKSSPNAAPSYMQEIKIDGKPVGDYFSKITTVRCEGDYIIVGGHAKKGSGNFYLVVGKIQQSADQLSNTVTWKVGKISGAEPYQLEDALILDGYVYLAGVSVINPNFHKGFVCALPLDGINRIANESELPFDANLFVGDENLQDRIYSIDGHSAS